MVEASQDRWGVGEWLPLSCTPFLLSASDAFKWVIDAHPNSNLGWSRRAGKIADTSPSIPWWLKSGLHGLGMGDGSSITGSSTSLGSPAHWNALPLPRSTIPSRNGRNSSFPYPEMAPHSPNSAGAGPAYPDVLAMLQGTRNCLPEVLARKYFMVLSQQCSTNTGLDCSHNVKVVWCLGA